MAISGNQWQSVAISGNHRSSEGIAGLDPALGSSDQWQSVAISGNHRFEAEDPQPLIRLSAVRVERRGERGTPSGLDVDIPELQLRERLVQVQALSEGRDAEITQCVVLQPQTAQRAAVERERYRERVGALGRDLIELEAEILQEAGARFRISGILLVIERQGQLRHPLVAYRVRKQPEGLKWLTAPDAHREVATADRCDIALLEAECEQRMRARQRAP